MDLDAVKKMFETAYGQKTLINAKEGREYYKNKGKIKETGTAVLDVINTFLHSVGSNPLKSADNRISTNYHRIFVDQKVGYMFTYPPQIDVKDDKINQIIKETLGDEYEKIMKSLAIDCSNTGVGWIHYWKNEKGEFEYYFVDPEEIRVILDNTHLKKPLKYLVRGYVITDEKGKDWDCFELWDNEEMIKFKRPAGEKGFDKLTPVFTDVLTSEQEKVNHEWGEIPFIKFNNNSIVTGDLEMYKDLIDAYDKITSGFVNDIDDLQEIVWVLKNYSGQTSKIVYDKEGNEIEAPFDILQELKAKKLVRVDGDGGLEAIRGEVPYQARQALLEIIRKQLPISAMAVDPIPDNTGNSSGVYIDYLYQLLELKAGGMETEFRSSINKLIRAICKAYGYDPKAIEQTWTRNKPRNAVEDAQIINNTSSEIVSNKTKTKTHPLVENYQDELEQIEKEKAESTEGMSDLPMFPKKDVNDGKVKE